MSTEICNSKLKTATVFGDDSNQTYVLKRWNGSIDIDTMGVGINVSEQDVEPLIKALRALSKLSYDD